MGSAKVSVLIKNGRIVTAVDDYYADIFENGHRRPDRKDLTIEADKHIDAPAGSSSPAGRSSYAP